MVVVAQDKYGSRWDRDAGRRMVTCHFHLEKEEWDCVPHHSDRDFASSDLELHDGSFSSVLPGTFTESPAGAVLSLEALGEDCKPRGFVVNWDEETGRWETIKGAAPLTRQPAALMYVPAVYLQGYGQECDGKKRDKEDGGSDLSVNPCWNGGKVLASSGGGGGGGGGGIVPRHGNEDDVKCKCRSGWEGRLCEERTVKRPTISPIAAVAMWSREDGRFAGAVSIDGHYSERKRCSFPDLPAGRRPAFGFVLGSTPVFCGGGGGGGGGNQRATEECFKLDVLSGKWSTAPPMNRWRSSSAHGFSLVVSNGAGGGTRAHYVLGGETASRCSFRGGDYAVSTLREQFEAADPQWRLDGKELRVSPHRSITCSADLGYGLSFHAVASKTSWNEGAEFYLRAGGEHVRLPPPEGRANSVREPLCAGITSEELRQLTGASSASGGVLVLDRGNSRPAYAFEVETESWHRLDDGLLPPLRPFHERLALLRTGGSLLGHMDPGRAVLLASARGRGSAVAFALNASRQRWEEASVAEGVEAPRRGDHLLVELTEEAVEELCD